MSDAAEVITVSFGGRTFRCSRRTAAHLAYTAQRLEVQQPSAQIVVLQGCYNTGVPASAGTHDKDAVLDFAVVNMTWWAAQRFFRECGWAAWYRFPPTFPNHIHAVSLGYPGEVGIYVPAQVDDYYRHALGLKGQHDSGDDPSWHPDAIDSTIFDYPAWVAELEDTMKDEDWKRLQTMLDSQRKSIVTDLLAATITKAGDTVKRALRLAAGLPKDET